MMEAEFEEDSRTNRICNSKCKVVKITELKGGAEGSYASGMVIAVGS